MNARDGTGVIDTNVVVLLDRLHPEDLPDWPVITAVTLAELSAGPASTEDPRERAARQQRLQEAEAAFDPVAFDGSAARAFGVVAAELRRGGRSVKPRAFDALIAATALAHGLPLYTCNPRDFAGIDALDLVEVPLRGSPQDCCAGEPGESTSMRGQRVRKELR